MLLRDGEIVAAAQEERFTRKKHDSAFPRHAIEYCLDAADSDFDELDYVAFYDKPFLKFERLLETYLAFAPRGFRSFRLSIPLWIREKLFQKRLLAQELGLLSGGLEFEDRLLFSEHHLSHAASAFYPSPFEEAVVLTMDGVGEWATTSVAIGSGNSLEVRKEIHFPHSLGLLYSAFTYYIGFRVNSGEYKLMGLAPYGEPKYADLIRRHLIDVREDGSFWMDQTYFDYCTGLTMTNKRFHRLFGHPPRDPEGALTQFHMDIAASIQVVTEEAVLRIVRSLAREYDCPNLCMAGGVALNCVANGLIQRQGHFDGFWVQPASGDAGGALGAALVAYHRFLGRDRVLSPSGADRMQNCSLGPEYTYDEVRAALDNCGASYQVRAEEELLDAVAGAIAAGKVVGWMQGRMEFGPRALGNRSILGNAQLPDSQRQINLKIKYRESFRPFAPAVTAESAGEWFDLESDSPYMLLVASVKARHRTKETGDGAGGQGLERVNEQRSSIPAVTHLDYSARVQTVAREANPRFHALITRVGALTGIPVVVNTSFNVRGEPIVCSPQDAFRCFMGTEMDLLVVGDCLLEKSSQNPALLSSYADHLELD